MIITMEECGELTQECSKILRKYKDFSELPEEDVGAESLTCTASGRSRSGAVNVIQW